jgi:hypothetical protein
MAGAGDSECNRLITEVTRATAFGLGPKKSHPKIEAVTKIFSRQSTRMDHCREDLPFLMQAGSSGTMISEWDPTSF